MLCNQGVWRKFKSPRWLSSAWRTSTPSWRLPGIWAFLPKSSSRLSTCGKSRISTLSSSAFRLSVARYFISKFKIFKEEISIRLFLLKRHPSTDKPLSARRKPIRTLASSLRNSWGPVTLSSPCSTAPTRVLTRAALTLAILGTCRLLNQKKKNQFNFFQKFFFFFNLAYIIPPNHTNCAFQQQRFLLLLL